MEIRVDGKRLKPISEFKYLGGVLDESGTDVAECCRKVVSGNKVVGAIKSQVNAIVCSLSVRGCCMRHCSCLFFCMVC